MVPSRWLLFSFLFSGFQVGRRVTPNCFPLSGYAFHISYQDARVPFKSLSNREIRRNYLPTIKCGKRKMCQEYVISESISDYPSAGMVIIYRVYRKEWELLQEHILQRKIVQFHYLILPSFFFRSYRFLEMSCEFNFLANLAETAYKDVLDGG